MGDAQIWAAFSVRDHLAPGAFLAESLLYDRLVIPVPPDDDREEWDRWTDPKQGWDPARQAELLKVLRPIVTEVPWTRPRREAWEREYLATKAVAGPVVAHRLAFPLTAGGLFDVVPAMADRVIATSPYTSLDDLTAELRIQRQPSTAALPDQTLSAVVGRELFVPEDPSRSEFELLEEAVRVVTTVPDYRNARAALNARLKKFTGDGVTDLESIRGALREINESMEQMAKAVRKRRIWVGARRAFAFAQVLVGIALAPVNPLAIGAVVLGLGQFTTTEMLADPKAIGRNSPDVAMLLDLRKELDLRDLGAVTRQ